MGKRERAKRGIHGGEPVVVAFTKRECLHCVTMKGPFAQLCRDFSEEILFFELENEDKFMGNEIRGYPHYILFRFGSKVGEIQGANEKLLMKSTEALISGDDMPSAPFFKGKVYQIWGMNTAYIGQTMQDLAKRFSQEESKYTHNSGVRKLLKDKKNTKHTVLSNVCQGNSKDQVRDCLDSVERLAIQVQHTHISEGGLNRTKGNRGMSKKHGYDYADCIPEHLRVEHFHEKEEKVQVAICDAIISRGPRKGQVCGKKKPCQYHRHKA